MVNYIISGNNELENKQFENLSEFADNHSIFFDLNFENEKQFKLLLDLLKIKPQSKTKLEGQDFLELIDISNNKLPLLNDEEYNEFYNNWLKQTRRENNMDEYGQFIFLQGMAKDLNQLKNRFFLKVVL
tara:strand:+ start:71 stop:457 length:387 start_codon:yes stop_codon:yes gene_type:complete